MPWTLHILCLILAQQPEPIRLGRPAEATVAVPALHRTSIVFSPDGSKLAWMHNQTDRGPNEGGGLMIHLWDIDKRLALSEMRPQNEFTYACSALCFTPNGRMLAAGCLQLTTEYEELAKSETRIGTNVRVWLVASGRELPIVPKENVTLQFRWQAVAVSPDGKVMTAISGKAGRTWKLPDGKVQSNINLPLAVNLVLADDGKLAAGTVADQSVQVWKTESGDDAGKAIVKLPGTGRALGFGPNGQHLATIHDDKLCLWEVASGKQIWAVPGKLGEDEKHGQRFDFSRDGKLLAWNDEGKITVVDAATGKTALTLKTQPGPIAFSPESQKLALACPDGTALIWAIVKQ
jgi:WD40 repeat protein